MGNDRLLLTNATVIDGTGQPPLYKASIEITNGRIATIAQHAEGLTESDNVTGLT